MVVLEPENIRVPEADDMPLERWTAYMDCVAICAGLHGKYYLCTINGESWIKIKWELL